MKPDLPDILDRYFKAQNAHDISAMVACFDSDASVHDEGRHIVGTDAIRTWKHETSVKYRITAEPLECAVEGGHTIVIVKVSGAFDGSPANLTTASGCPTTAGSAHRRSGNEQQSGTRWPACACHRRHQGDAGKQWWGSCARPVR